MKGLYSKLATFLTAVFFAGCAGAPVKKDIDVFSTPNPVTLEEEVEAPKKPPLEEEEEVEAPKKNPLVEKLEYISGYFDRKDINYYELESRTGTYFLARKNLDGDGVKDYILIVGNRRNIGYDHPGGLNSIYIEDRSKGTGLGTVDKSSIYVEIDGVKQILHFDSNGYLKILTEYVNLMKTDPENEKIKTLWYQWRNYQKQRRDAGIIYFNVISNTKDVLVRKELTDATMEELGSIIELDNPLKFKFF